jgi:entericidin B
VFVPAPLVVDIFGPDRKDNLMKKLLLALAATAVCLSATACHTVKGVGKDIESVGTATDSDHR